MRIRQAVNTEGPHKHINIHRAFQIHYAFKFINLFLGFFFQILVVKTLPPSGYATYAIFLAILLTMERLLSFGIDRTLLRYVPSLTADGDYQGLAALLKRVALVRGGSILVALGAIGLLATFARDTLLMGEGMLTICAFAVWYAGYAVTTDLEMLAQSWIVHATTAISGTIDVLLRSACVLLLALSGHEISGATVIAISAVTTFVAVIIILLKLIRLRPHISSLLIATSEQRLPRLSAKDAPLFAASIYASNIGWLITSPSVVRIFAKGGLDIVTFSAFSFVQGLCVSIQRAFPGLMILPSLEPLFARFTMAPARVFSSLSLVFKLELVCFLAFSILTGLAGREIIALVSRPEYAPYYYLLPLVMLILLFQTIYRICEIVTSAQLKHTVFLALWPVSLLGVAALYLTADRWGLLAVLFIPLTESAIRIGIIMLAHRRVETWRAIDPVRSLQVGTAAGGSVLFALLARYARPDFGNLTLAVLATGLFFLTVFVVRPLRKDEVASLSLTMPSSLQSLSRAITRWAR